MQESEVTAKPNPNIADVYPINQSTFRSESGEQYVNMGIRVFITHGGEVSKNC